MSKIFKYLKPYWLFALLCPLSMILEVSMDLIQPQLMSNIVDNGILGGGALDENLQYVLRTGLFMLGFSLLRGRYRVGGVRHDRSTEVRQRHEKRHL